MTMGDSSQGLPGSRHLQRYHELDMAPGSAACMNLDYFYSYDPNLDIFSIGQYKNGVRTTPC
jgi:hypothetical protein